MDRQSRQRETVAHRTRYIPGSRVFGASLVHSTTPVGRLRGRAAPAEKCVPTVWQKYFGPAPLRPVWLQMQNGLPEGVALDAYHKRLIEEARTITNEFLSTALPGTRFPWYLMQQVFLYLIARNSMPDNLSRLGSKGGHLMAHYRKFAKFLGGQIPMTLEERAIFLILAHTGFGSLDIAPLFLSSSISDEFLSRLNSISPFVATELWSKLPSHEKDRMSHIANKLRIDDSRPHGRETTLASLSAKSENPFLEEEKSSNSCRLAI